MAHRATVRSPIDSGVAPAGWVCCGSSSKALVLLKGHQPLTPSADDEEPLERLWGFRLLRERAGIDLEVAAPTPEPSLTDRILGRLRPEPSICGVSASRSLIASLTSTIDRFDAVLTISQIASASLLTLKSRRHVGPRVVCLALGMADRLLTMSPSDRRRAVAMLAFADSLLGMSPAECEVLQGLGLRQTVMLPFGVDTGYWSPRPVVDGEYVFAVGSDPCRDFDTLIQACPYPLRIMTLARRLVTVPVPPHVTFVNGGTGALRDLYAGARLVVVPLKQRLQPSGQNTVLQAMAMAKAVVLTRTRGLWSEELRHGHNCMLTAPDSATDMRDCIRQLWESPGLATRVGGKGRSTVQDSFQVSRLVDTLFAQLTEPARERQTLASLG